MPCFNPDELPIVPHGGECSGCLIVIELHNGTANLVCNECGTLIRTVPTDEAAQILMRMAAERRICSATCPHCQALNTFLGFTSVEAYICRECGESVSIERKVQ